MLLLLLRRSHHTPCAQCMSCTACSLQASIELEGVKGMWSLRESQAAAFDKYLVQSFSNGQFYFNMFLSRGGAPCVHTAATARKSGLDAVCSVLWLTASNSHV